MGPGRAFSDARSRACPIFHRAFAAGCLGAVVLGLLACSSATARMEPSVRVLLYNGPGPLRVGPAKAPSKVRVGPGGRVQVDGVAVPGIWLPEGSGPWRVGSRTVRGQVVVRVRGHELEVVNRIGLEDYVASTVGGEMSSSWPREALRAQAVAARTYVLYEAAKRRDSDWDVRATTRSQVYEGTQAETPETRSATRATAGEVLTYGGEPILAVFHSTAGGRTERAAEVWGEDLPYLRVVEVEDEDDSPQTYWRTAFAPGALQGVLAAAGVGVGRLESIVVTERTGSGRVKRLAFRGGAGVRELRGAALKSLVASLGLRSTLFDIRETPAGFVFVGSGYGHGVGMSQWGARAMARQGASYRRILARFYPGTQLGRVPSRLAVASGPSSRNEGDER